MSEYQAKNWLNYTNTTTPITANDLNRIDSGVENLMTRVTALEQRGSGGTTSAGISAAILAGANGTAGMVSEYEEGN